MGSGGGCPDTVVGVMVDTPDLPDDASDTAEDRPTEQPAPRSGLRSLDRRTVAIVACIALVAALLAGLIASFALGGDEATDDNVMTLTEPGEIDTSRLLAEPLETVDGEPTNVGSYLNEQPMLINIWSSNCAPCVQEMPLLQQAADDNSDITFVGVATQDDPAKAQELAEQTGITYPWALDPTGEFFYESKGAGMPTTLLLSADGDVVATKTGQFHDEQELQAFLDEAS